MQDLIEKKLEQAYQMKSGIMDKLDADQAAIESKCGAASEFEMRIQTQVKEIVWFLEKLDHPRVDQAHSVLRYWLQRRRKWMKDVQI